jgi:threonine dehydratase
MLAERCLRDPELFRNENGTDAILHQIAINLGPEMGLWVSEPLKDLKPAFVCESLKRILDLHFVTLLSYEELVNVSKRVKLMSSNAITRERIAETALLIRPYIRRTPMLLADRCDFGLAPGSLAFKLEYLQHTGSFKARGAFTHFLTRRIPRAGVAAASGGNHGAAVAYAASVTGHSATVFVPDAVSPAKAERIGEYGARLVIAGNRYADALAACETFVRKSGALPVHAFDAEETLLGQATVGLEIEQDTPFLDTLLVAVGGGGLIGGIAAWFRGRVRLIAVEPELAPTLHMALTAGKPVEAPAGGITADSLAPKRVGTMMFPLARDYVDRSILVTDDEIKAVQLSLWKRLRIVAEPGGAAAFAALLSGKYRPEADERVGVVLSGANTTAVQFS